MSGAESNVVAGTNSSSGGPVAGVWCVVVAGGSGTRFGSLKQFESLSGTRVIVRSAMTAAEVCEGVVVVVPSGIIGTYEAIIEGATAVVAG
ncbi:MAG TPA: NTP transferase domain-containing protein, partial [Microthrixaceae bacterium]|nr:NTP transferase domain-containing protein [Microthrixaceae bacterium]